jgi:acetyl-CoA C-acetyltransferase
VLQRTDDLAEAAEPLELMIDALRRAGEDAGAPKLLARAGQIRVIQGIWRYGDPGRTVGERLGASQFETVGSHFGGNYVQANVNDAALEIQSGRQQIVLVTGAETGRSYSLAKKQGVRLDQSELPGKPDRMFGANMALAHEAELARGVRMPVEMYAIFESAIRHARGESLAEHRKRISELWAGFNAVAQRNPNAWIRKAYSADEIGTAGPDNPMIGLPYPRMMNSNSRVDMGAGIILCSRGAALEAGVPEDKLVYLHAGTDANDQIFPSLRQDFHRSPAIRIAGNRALELAQTSVDEISHFDLYSCFPSAVQVSKHELAVPDGRELTVTGGLTFGGGPMNDYVMHSIARMTEVLREDRGAKGLVTGNGGYLAKHSFGVYSTDPAPGGFKHENLQAEVDREPSREALVDFDGPVEIEAYTVMFGGSDTPRIGHAACLTPDGQRTWGNVEDPDLLDTMVEQECCGRAAKLNGQGRLELQ